MSEIKPCPVCGNERETRECGSGLNTTSYQATCPVLHVSVRARTPEARDRAWAILCDDTPTDRRCGTCARWDHENVEDDRRAFCFAQGWIDDDPVLCPKTSEEFGNWCFAWELRGAE